MKNNRIISRHSLFGRLAWLVVVAGIAASAGCTSAKAPTPTTPPTSQPPSTSTAPPTQPNTAATPTGAITYTSKIKPLLDQKCVSCHKAGGSVATIPLDTYPNVMKYVTPKNSSDSKLVQSVIGGSMSDKLTGDEAQTIKQWVDQGATQ